MGVFFQKPTWVVSLLTFDVAIGKEVRYANDKNFSIVPMLRDKKSGHGTQLFGFGKTDSVMRERVFCRDC